MIEPADGSIVESGHGLGVLSKDGRRCSAVHYRFEVHRLPGENHDHEGDATLRVEGMLNWLDSHLRIEPEQTYVLDLDDGRRLALVPGTVTFMGRQARFGGARWLSGEG